jgi:hypothetical protein
VKIDYGALMILLVGLQYFGAMVLFGWTARPWTALTYFGYMLGNVGLFATTLGYK